MRRARCGRGKNYGARQPPSRGGHLDDGRYNRNLNTNSSERIFPVKRGPFSQNGGPCSKRAAFFAPSKSAN